MNESIAAARPAARPIRIGPARLLARRAIHRILERLRHGCLTLKDGTDERAYGEETRDFPVSATVVVRDPAFYPAILLDGSIGAGESYMAGHWETEDLTAVIRIFVRNLEAMEAMESGAARLTAPFHRAFHRLRRGTRRNSRSNIAAHYDLGNDFYALFLDETMTYSAGIFEREDSTLAEASIAKYERIARKLALSPEDRVLEIGTGWGGFAVHAAERFGCRITTATISREQHEYATERVRRAGLSDRVTILLEDYRDLTGEFDKLVSIEMIEAVGHEFHGDFFRTCGARLRPRGLMALQAIVIRDDRYEQQLRRPDFIKRHIFPGSCIPSVTALGEAAARTSDLRLVHLEDIAPHYAKTLRIWRERFLENLPAVRALGFSETFVRMWEFYLSYCEGSFLERYIGDVQAIYARPRCRQAPIPGVP
jgi:cyclopropane-fatty-acyl-phospholipid synthase